MKDHVYPDDIRRIPVKALPPEDQAPFIALARALHEVRAEQTRLAAAGFSQDARGVRIPTWGLVQEWLAAHPEPAAVTLIQAQARRLFQVQTPWLTRDLARVKAQGPRLVAGKELVAEAGAEVQEKDRIAAILARLFAALPATFAQRQTLDQVPGTEAGWLALGAFLDAEEERFRGLEVRAREILAEIDRRAWDLYRPATPREP
jgi:hypothetical protein